MTCTNMGLHHVCRRPCNSVISRWQVTGGRGLLLGCMQG